MVGEEQQGSTADRIYDALDSIHGRYKAVETRVRGVTPYVIRTLEVILAVALLAGLTRWFYLFYVA
ncbi:hypothetical protein ACYJ1Y_13270 [Natrialbaceae archaeon A-gly3]